MKKALIIFARHPEQGKVKTRLAKTMGEAKALSIYKELLMHTHNITKYIEADKFVFLAEEPREDNFPVWKYPLNCFDLQIQKGSDLGMRMQNAFTYVFSKGYELACIIGSDCMELTQKDITEAFHYLQRNDLVIGPSEDGGYYLLGMKQAFPELFKNKPWSTDKVLSNTISDAWLLQLSFHLLPVLSDIDTEEDWLSYQQKIN